MFYILPFSNNKHNHSSITPIWVLLWISGFTPIMYVKSIFDNKTLTYFFFARKQQTQVTQITQYPSSFPHHDNGLQFRLLHLLCLFVFFPAAFLKTFTSTWCTSVLLYLYDFMTKSVH